ncbi:MAG: hypothetical protein WBP58_09135 [Chitinophagaceae bacterium]
MRILLIGLLSFHFFFSQGQKRFDITLWDFTPSQRMVLIEALATGVASPLDSSDDAQFLDPELVKLTKIEIPTLRAVAFLQLLNRSHLDHFSLVMDHLEDTAFVVHDHGHYGFRFEAVTEMILDEAEWPTKELRDSTLQALMLLPYKYLSTYEGVQAVRTNPKYYACIKQMIVTPRVVSGGYHLNNEVLKEKAMYGLAKYRIPSDIAFLKVELLKNYWNLKETAFRLLRDFPDTAYLDVLEQYHRRGFYRTLNYQKDGFTGFKYEHVNAEDFIRAVGAHHHKRAAVILDTIMQRIPRFTNVDDPDYLKLIVVNTFSTSEVPAFQYLKRKYAKAVAESKAQQFRSTEILRVIDSTVNSLVDSTSIDIDPGLKKQEKKSIRWYRWFEE